MKIGFIENKLILTSSGACNLAKEWMDLLKLDHEVEWATFVDNAEFGSDYWNTPYTELHEKSEALENYDMIIVNMLGPSSQKFFDALRNCKRAVTIYVYHDRTVIRDIFNEPDMMAYVNACDYVLTYQPRFLIDKMKVSRDKVLPIDVVTFFKDSSGYTKILKSIDERKIDQLFCNRTNNFKGSRLFMGWCKYLRDKGHNDSRVMKGFHPDYPHQDLPNYDIKPYMDDWRNKEQDTSADFFIENYGANFRCLELLQNARFVWLAQDYSKYPEDKFSSLEEYMGYLNFDLDGTTLEAIFSGCIPILHVANKKCELLQNFQDSILFYDPDKGYDDLYEQYKKIDANIAQEKLKDLRELYEAKEIFRSGLNIAITPQVAFEATKMLAKQAAETNF